MKKKIAVVFAALLIFLSLPLPASANSVEPPLLTVMVIGPREDLSLTLEFSFQGKKQSVEVTGERLIWETFYRFSRYDFPVSWDDDPDDLSLQLIADTGEEQISFPIDPEKDLGYNSLFTLDMNSLTLEKGQPFWRAPALIGIRVLLTLALEGGMFLLFGYREKRSWITFLVTNLITQLGVNVLICTVLSPSDIGFHASALLVAFLYTPMEILVLFGEMIAFCVLLKEHTKPRAAGFATVANLLSWGLGAFLLLCFPI